MREIQHGILPACGTNPVEVILVASGEGDPAGREKAKATARKLMRESPPSANPRSALV